MNDSTYRVRAMTESDLQGAEDLFKAAYARAEMGPEHRRWFLQKNPFSKRIGYVAEATDGRIVGHVSYVPVPFRRPSGRALGAFMVMAMIHPDFQKRGMFKALVAATETQHDEDHVEVVQAFPNDNSVHAFTHNFGWSKLVGANYIYFKVLNWSEVVRGKLHLEPLAQLVGAVVDPVARFSVNRKPTCTIRRVDRFDDRMDQLWDTFARNLPNAIDRTSHYLNWRLGEAPSASYRIFLAEDGARLVGALITKREERFGLQVGYVVELIFDPAKASVGRDLLRHAVTTLREDGCAVALAATAGSRLIRRTLYGGGFWHLPKRVMPHGIHFVYKVRTQKPGESDRYFVSWLDHDLL